MKTFTLDGILDALDAHHQRATYGAVAGLLGVPARGVMLHRPRDWRHSWVVNARSGQPTAYAPDAIHPQLERRAAVISSPNALWDWLAHPE